MSRTPIVDTADVLQVVVKDGEPRLVLGDALTGDGKGKEVTMWGAAGMYVFPRAPDADGAARCLYMHDGNTLRSIGTVDSRLRGKVGQGEEGDSIWIGYGEKNRILQKAADDSVTLYTECDGSGKSIMITASGKNKNVLIAIGSTTIEAKENELTLIAGGCSLSMKDGAITIVGSFFHAATASGRLGVIGPVAPQPPANAVLYGVSGMTGVPSTSWAVSP